MDLYLTFTPKFLANSTSVALRSSNNEAMVEEKTTHSFWGLETTIESLESELGKVNDQELKPNEKNLRQLERDVETYHHRLQRDKEIKQYKEGKANEISLKYEADKAAAIKKNKRLHSGARKLQIKTNDEILKLIPANHPDEYFITDEGEETYTLRYVDPAGVLKVIDIPEEKKQQFDYEIRIRIEEDKESVGLLHHGFVVIVTENSITNPDKPGTGHYSTSWDGQYLKLDKERDAAYKAQWDQIGANFAANKAAAIKKNDRLHNGERQLHIKTEDQFQHLIRDKHTDEYFITATGEEGQKTYTLRYIDTAGRDQVIGIANAKQERFDNAIRDRIPNQQNEALTLSHADFVDVVTNNTLVEDNDGSIPDKNVNTAHFSTSLEAQNLRSERIRTVQDIITEQQRRDEDLLLPDPEMFSFIWSQGLYPRAVDLVIANGAYKIGRACLWDFPKWLGGEIGRTIYGVAEQICSQLARAARRVSPYSDALVEYSNYGINKAVTAAGRTIYRGIEQSGSKLARIERRVTPYIVHPFVWGDYYLNNAYEGTKRAITRSWYDWSPFKYYDRLEGINNAA